MIFPSTTLLNDMSEVTHEILHWAEDDLFSLSDEELNWKPSEKKWSIAQCLEHLNFYGDFYLPRFQEAISYGRDNGMRSKWKFKSGWLGDYFTKSMLGKEGVVKNKMKTFRKKNPRYSEVPHYVVDRFVDQQKELLGLIEESRHIDISNIRIPITISPLVKLKLGDSFRFVIAHNLRHKLQAERVMVGMLEAEPMQ